MSFWDNDLEKYNEKWKKDFSDIGKLVYSFFIDKAAQRGFEIREGQWDMACEIVDAMKKKQHILVEAGVGIGKTFAYLVPLLYYHYLYKKPIIIATSTIALQEQLKSDIETLINIFGYKLPVILAKGQNHYLCYHRLDQYFLSKNDEENKALYNKLSKSGYQKSDWDFDIGDKLWDQINVKEYNSNFCRQNCLATHKCHYRWLRHELLETDGIILCNQDLLTANLKKRISDSKEIFTNKVQFIVIDEAHNLESKVRNSFTYEANYTLLLKTVEKSKKILGNNSLSLLDEKIKEYSKYLDQVFDDLYTQIKMQDKKAKKTGREIERYFINQNKIPALEDLAKCVDEIYTESSLSIGASYKHSSKDFDAESEAIELQMDFWKSMLKDDSPNIFWMTKKGNNKYGITLFSCPKNVNNLTEQLYFSNSDCQTILTSATITSSKTDDYVEGYDYFISNTNFPRENTVIAEPKESPFNYDEHAMIYYTENMPHPSNQRDAFIEKGAEEIIKLLEISNGKALILFTAKNDMNAVYEKLKNKIPYKLLKQGISSQSDIISEFKDDINSVLLGTGTFWEGISVEGMALSNLIIFKLPFPVPEPIIEYKRVNSDNGLMKVLVPEMIIKLKQGIGRLIRNEKDCGIVSIIDSRVGEASTASYKNIIWDALPIKNKTNDLRELNKFYSQLENNKH